MYSVDTPIADLALDAKTSNNDDEKEHCLFIDEAYLLQEHSKQENKCANKNNFFDPLKIFCGNIFFLLGENKNKKQMVVWFR